LWGSRWSHRSTTGPFILLGLVVAFLGILRVLGILIVFGVFGVFGVILWVLARLLAGVGYASFDERLGIAAAVRFVVDPAALGPFESGVENPRQTRAMHPVAFTFKGDLPYLCRTAN
jgi:hypothetical protein